MPGTFLNELAAKLLFLRGRQSLTQIAEVMAIPPSLCAEILGSLRTHRMAEVTRGGATDADAEYHLTESGRLRAAEALDRCQYAGAVPVPLSDYTKIVVRQSSWGIPLQRTQVHAAFADLVVPRDIVDVLGAAMNSGRPVLLYGPAGSGKTYLAEHLARLLPGTIGVPYAVLIGGEVMQVFDPLVHQPAPRSVSDTSAFLADHDRRWNACGRPVLITGGELTLQMLDMQFDTSTRYYQAPPHLKANGGLLVVDDLGRQRISPSELMNRWIVPLSRRLDYLSLHNGAKFVVPFEMAVVFSTNLHPTELADEAFLRRFGYKVLVGPLSVEDYRRVFERACSDNQVRFDERAFEWLLTERHQASGRPLLACYPADLTGRIRDFAQFEGSTPEMSTETLGRAWESYFVSAPSPVPISNSHPRPHRGHA